MNRDNVQWEATHGQNLSTHSSGKSLVVVWLALLSDFEVLRKIFPQGTYIF